MWLIWITMLVSGLWTLFTGKVPMVLFSGLGTHKVEGRAAKVIGICLALPVPVGIATVFILGFFLGTDQAIFDWILAVALTLLSAIAAIFVVRRNRTPYELTDTAGNPVSPEAVEADRVVRQKVQRSMYLLALGLGLAVVVHVAIAFAVFLIAYFQANRAVPSAKETGVKDRYGDDANLIRLLSAVLAVFSALLFFGVLR